MESNNMTSLVIIVIKVTLGEEGLRKNGARKVIAWTSPMFHLCGVRVSI